MLNGLPEKLTERYNRGNCKIIPSLAHQPRDRVERIEKKVRLDLPAQRFELSFGKLLSETRCFSLLMNQPRSGLQEVTHRQNARIQEHTLKKAIVGLIEPQRREGFWVQRLA